MKSILNNKIISERYFFPRKDYFENPYWIDCGNANLGCKYFIKDKSAKTIIHFHGNGEIISDYFSGFVPKFHELGYNIFLFEYRGYGMSNGNPELVTILNDTELMIRQINLPLENIILFGRSVGSIYAIHAASCFPEISGLIIESGIANILERMLMRVTPVELNLDEDSFENEVLKHFDNESKISEFRGSSLFLHSEYDGLVDKTHAKKLFVAANEPKHLTIFPEGNHNTIISVNWHEYFNLIDNFIKKIEILPNSGK
ncbi:MAG: alpha/beta hydrolase [Bacteroidetes bacterium]|jgi:alpha-beta hydrolase superfamily lysophospholipase|nr:alpha/beta hydrolase [Bacteroidota bacterium]MBT6687131.1 alpha/beta hydrolase [Bacteroidota bacterium]MBT7145138.1 alpha/beta hydrolase [Bacteroidota bacterium]MBT7491929.1 alpha/beta hydrolase [Bacteroidota bacterium]